ncbi:hypothetical protein BCR44DRAFT_1426217 [Catenaria anguillulae PL171]|uniref:Uncharacterized protein n=1 Tax=Catenaria anguillulae PL171 TaxID=765915 RepID=A0A1Y2I3W4_9FUNG|nr:hypothetical protein BCR44DRAFT_1426217 [Catenaria anguillulae PL171]
MLRSTSIRRRRRNRTRRNDDTQIHNQSETAHSTCRARYIAPTRARVLKEKNRRHRSACAGNRCSQPSSALHGG